MKFTKRNIFIFTTIVITIIVDQFSKYLVVEHVKMGSSAPIIGEFFQLLHVKNQGAFLGMGSDLNDTLRVLLLLILPVLVLGFVLRHIFKDKTLDNWSLFAFASIIGGGIANVYDRYAYGEVTDFLFMKLTDTIRTGIFNLADLSVSTGMVILVIMMYKNKNKTSK